MSRQKDKEDWIAEWRDELEFEIRKHELLLQAIRERIGKRSDDDIHGRLVCAEVDFKSIIALAGECWD